MELWRRKEIAMENCDSDSEAFVEALKRGDSNAWIEAKRLAVCAVFADARFKTMASAKNITEEDALSALFEKMIAGGRLAHLKDNNQVVSYLSIYVKKYIRDFYTEKERRIMPLAALSGVVDESVDAKINMSMMHYFAGRRSFSKCAKKYDTLSIQRSFHKLWKRNPIRAYVLMFRMRENLSSRQIMKICNLSSENYCNKVLERAKRDMSALLKEVM